jgi:hypothetical protein
VTEALLPRQSPAAPIDRLSLARSGLNVETDIGSFLSRVYLMVSAPFTRGDWMALLISFLSVGMWMSSSFLM